VAKINTAGSARVYSTYLGGSGLDRGLAIAVDGAGNALVTGFTGSSNFPTTNPLQASNGGGFDAFATKINAMGSARVYSTYLGGPMGTLARASRQTARATPTCRATLYRPIFPRSSLCRPAMAAVRTGSCCRFRPIRSRTQRSWGQPRGRQWTDSNDDVYVQRSSRVAGSWRFKRPGQ